MTEALPEGLKVDPALDYDYLTPQQYEVLMRELHAGRIEKRTINGSQMSYLSQQDVRAHLSRMFGLARWSAEVLESEMVIHKEAEIGKDKKPGWYIAHKVRLQLSICAPNGQIIARYTEVAIAGNKQPEEHEAMDQSLKSAASDALKRCAINLGDQFGLSLYDKGSVGKIVKITLVKPTPDGRAEPAPGSPATTAAQVEQLDPTSIVTPPDEAELARAQEQIALSMQAETVPQVGSGTGVDPEVLPDPAPTAPSEPQEAQPEPSWPSVTQPPDAPQASTWRPEGTIAEQEAAAAERLVQRELGGEVIPGHTERPLGGAAQ